MRYIIININFNRIKMSEEDITSNTTHNSSIISRKDSVNNSSNTGNSSSINNTVGIDNKAFTNDKLEEGTINEIGISNTGAISNNNNANNNSNNNNANNNTDNDVNNDEGDNCDNNCKDEPKEKSRILKAISPPPLVKKPPRDPKLKKPNLMKRHMSIAKGFMDISLFGANANQLRILLSFGDRDNYTHYVILASLLISLTVQLISGITLIVKEKFDLEDEWSHYLNNVIVIQVFFIVLINVFLTGFGVSLISKEELVLIELRKNQTLFNKYSLGNT